MTKNQTLSRDNETQSLRDRFSNALIENGSKPTHFVTVAYCQSIKINDTYVKADDIIYDQVHQSFMRSLSKRLCSSRQWKRSNRVIRSFGAIEGGKNSQRFHAHFVVCKPEHVDEAKFLASIEKTAANNLWILNGKFAVKVQTLDERTDAFNATNYSMKYSDSLDRLLST